MRPKFSWGKKVDLEKVSWVYKPPLGFYICVNAVLKWAQKVAFIFLA